MNINLIKIIVYNLLRIKIKVLKVFKKIVEIDKKMNI